MRRLVITKQFESGPVVVETSSGVRAAGATVQSALQKLDLGGLMQQEEFDSVATLFERIRPSGGGGQIAQGQAAA